VSARPPAPDPPVFRRLLPDPATLTAAELLDTLDPIARAGNERPYTIVNFVAGVDGRVAVEGRSAPLSDRGDRAMFHELRERVDAVLAGTRTMETEGYGRLVRDPARRARRAARGLAPDPLACLITRSGEVPVQIPLFADPHSRVVVFTPRPLAPGAGAAAVDTVLVDPGALTLTTALRRLRSDHDVRALLCEGGPTLFSGLLAEGLVDELFLSLSPRLTGGSEPAVTSDRALRPPVELDLAWAVEREGTLFLRYRRD
jgi:5-amino-6-(5-phosphoribosylamino)uracil reductase